MVLFSCVKPAHVGQPQLHTYTPIETHAEQRVYVCQVENIATHKQYIARQTNKNLAIKQARQQCLAGRDAEQCSIDFVCRAH